VPAVSFVTAAETPVAREPEPALFAEVFDPYEVVRPYSNHQVVALPAGLTDPVSVAPEVDAPWAEPVRTTGGPALPNVRSWPKLVPAGLEATRRKW